MAASKTHDVAGTIGGGVSALLIFSVFSSVAVILLFLWVKRRVKRKRIEAVQMDILEKYGYVICLNNLQSPVCAG